jgi:hypothetical protein
MLELFFSCVCEFCENPCFDGFHSGFVIWRGRSGGKEYVFPTRRDAEHYQGVSDLLEFPIRSVLCREPFRFQKSRGSIADLELADQLYEVFPDHRFRWSRGRAFLAPGAAPAAASG